MSEKGKKVAESILRIRRDIIDSHGHDPNSWHIVEKIQGYRDSLEAMKRGGLISDYNLFDDTVKG